MNCLAYSFDLNIADYIAMNMHPWRDNTRLFRGIAPSAGIVLISAFFFLRVAGHMAPGWAFLAAGGIALCYLLVSPLFWRYRYRARLRKYYGQPPADRLLGLHTLSIGPEGIESTGPYHRTYRAWPAVTGACVTADYTLIYTIFGNVYILPGRVVEDRAAVRRALEAHLPSSVIIDV
jgi:hypothetical protein